MSHLLPRAAHRLRCIPAVLATLGEFVVTLASPWCKPHARSCTVDRNQASSPELRRSPPRTAAGADVLRAPGDAAVRSGANGSDLIRHQVNRQLTGQLNCDPVAFAKETLAF
jgi:hypothetical protein